MCTFHKWDSIHAATCTSVSSGVDSFVDALKAEIASEAESGNPGTLVKEFNGFEVCAVIWLVLGV